MTIGETRWRLRGTPKLKQKCRSCGIHKTWKLLSPAVTSVHGPAANAQCAQSSNVHFGCSGDANVAMEDSVLDVNKTTEEIKVMQNIVCTIPLGEL